VNAHRRAAAGAIALGMLSCIVAANPDRATIEAAKGADADLVAEAAQRLA